jgi:hypothetical protein
MELLESAHNERTGRASPAEQRHVVARSRYDVISTDQLADTAAAETRREGAGEEWDDVAFRRIELSA